jgi:NAD(P)H-hydrate repair Nnr-like enzyme with NAD(P)H-hydrate dehydratase domain
MASAGSGDVLSGILAGILAQSRAGAVSRWFDAFEVAAMAVHAHSQAGRKAAQIHGNSLMASDLIEQFVIRNS